MKKITLSLFLTLLFFACDQNEDIENQQADFELSSVSQYDFDISFSNARTNEMEIESVDLVSFRTEGEIHAVNTILVNTKEEHTRKIVMLSPDNKEIYSVIKAIDLHDGSNRIEYYDGKGILYMSGIQKGSQIQILDSVDPEMYTTSSASGRTTGYWTSFGDCFAHTVIVISSDAMYSAAIGLGLVMGYAPYIAGGLTLGCGIYALGGSAYQTVSPTTLPTPRQLTVPVLQTTYSDNYIMIRAI